jgi:hypothetical protein
MPKEVSELKSRCNQHGILVATHNPTPAEVIPIVEQHLADHQNDFAKTMDPSSGYYAEWKSTHDNFTQFLTELHAAESSSLGGRASSRAVNIPETSDLPNPSNAQESHQNNFPPEKPPQSDPTLPNQRSTGETDVIQSDPEVIQSDPKAIQNDPRLTSSDPGSPKTNPDHHASGADASPQSDQPNDIEDEIDDDGEEDFEDDEEQEEDDEELDEDFDITEYLDADAAEAALDLREYLSGGSLLDNLEPRIQQAILRLLEDYKPEFVAEAIAEPPPIGLGVRTSSASLKRFRRRYRAAEEDAQKAQHAKAIQDLLAQANTSDEAFQTAIQRLLKTRLLTTTSDPNAPLETIDTLITSLNKLRKQTLAERKQTHIEEKDLSK